MPALADVLPAYTDCATVLADNDKDGRRFATQLAERIQAFGIEARTIIAGAMLGAAA